MPTRNFYFPDDLRHIEKILVDAHGDECASNFQNFRDKNIAPLFNTGSIGFALGISSKIIFSITEKPSWHYRNFQIKKRRGGIRRISAPRTYLKVIQWWMYDNILSRISLPSNVFGFVKGRSVYDNAEYHFGAKHVLNIDIKDFFPSIHLPEIIIFFEHLGYKSEIALQLARITTFRNALPQGAPTIPALANLIFAPNDEVLNKLALEYGMKYSRYADDLTFSSAKWIDKTFLKEVKLRIKNFGFKLNNKKTRFCGPGDRIEVTGFVINRVLQPSRTWRKCTRAAMHQINRKRRIEREDIDFLHGIKGFAMQVKDSRSMEAMALEVDQLLRKPQRR